MVNKGIYVTEKKGVTFLFFGSYRNSCISNPEACGPEGETFINSDWLFFCCLIVFFSNHCSFRPWNEIQSIFRPAVTFAVSWPGLFVDKVIHRDTHRTVLCFWDRYFTFVWVGTSGWCLWLCTAVPWFDTLLWQKGTAAQGQAQEPQCGQGWAQEGPLLQLPALETPNEVQVPSGDQDFGFQKEELLRHSAVSWLRSRDAELGEGLFIGVIGAAAALLILEMLSWFVPEDELSSKAFPLSVLYTLEIFYCARFFHSSFSPLPSSGVTFSFFWKTQDQQAKLLPASGGRVISSGFKICSNEGEGSVEFYTRGNAMMKWKASFSPPGKVYIDFKKQFICNIGLYSCSQM